MTTNSENLSRRQERALLALLESNGLSLNLVAEKAEISLSTLHRYMKQPEFLSIWREMRAQKVEQAIARMQSLMDEAVETLRRNLDTGNRPSEVRSAVAILRQSLEAVDTFDLAQRIQKIESDLESHENKK